MIRRQIRLDDWEHALVKQEAVALGISVAEFVRRALRQTLLKNDKAPWMKYAGLVESRDPNSTQSIDEVVYGSKH